MIDFDDEPDQEKRIEKLRAQLEKLGGEVSDNSQLSADLEEAFLKHILAFEPLNLARRGSFAHETLGGHQPHGFTGCISAQHKSSQ